MRPLLFVLLFVLLTGITACGGTGDAPSTSSSTPATVDLPVKQVELGPVDATLSAEGQQVFETRCTTCHKLDVRYVGPALGDVAERRAPEYVMNMILAPEKMLMSDPDAKALLAEYGVPMTNQNLSQDEARAILEYLRQLAEGAE